MDAKQKFPQPVQWEPLSAVPILAGLFWLLGGEGWWLFWALLPGALLLASGVALLLMPGDQRVHEYMALGGFVGTIAALPAMVPGDLLSGLIAFGVSAAAYVVAGRVALMHAPRVEDAPRPDLTVAVCAKAALDEALLAYFVGSARMPDAGDVEQQIRQLAEFERIAAAEGWADKPEQLHHEPPAPEHSYSTAATVLGQSYEQVHYESGFEPRADLPGAQEWRSEKDNAASIAWVKRHAVTGRPWLLCIHGYRMGLPWMDFSLFPMGWLHHKLGLNLMLPVLPLHGPRRIGLRSGDDYLEGDPTTLFHAQTQALWDLRRAIKWIRTQDPQARIGVLGFSLGGYNTALLSQYASGLDFVIAGIPAVDFSELIWRHVPPLHRRYYESQGVTQERLQRLLRPLSPLARKPLVAENARYIFAGSADRVVTPDQIPQLARHWNAPVQWYHGGHLSFRSERAVRAHIEAAMTRAGWDVEAVSIPAT